MTIHTLYQALANKVARVRRAEGFLALQTGLLNALAGLIALWTLAAILEYSMEFGTTGRTVLFWSGVAITIAILLRTLAVPLGRLTGLLHPQSDDIIARRVGAKINAIGDRLVNTFQLYRAVHAGGNAAGPDISLELAEASILVQGKPLWITTILLFLRKKTADAQRCCC